ncbi:hypothetical protein Hanom_Chr16g01460231 [Helianthus anomalus]
MLTELIPIENSLRSTGYPSSFLLLLRNVFLSCNTTFPVICKIAIFFCYLSTNKNLATRGNLMVKGGPECLRSQTMLGGPSPPSLVGIR